MTRFRRGLVFLAATGMAGAGMTALAGGATQAAGGSSGAAAGGTFSQPFQEAGIPNASHPTCTAAESFANQCIPTAVSAAVLANGKILYWNGLEGSERANIGTVPQFGSFAASDQSRVLDLGSLTWTKPTPVDGGGAGTPPDLFLPGTPINQGDDHALFCSSLVQLADGRIMSTGGTDYYDEPGIPVMGLGVTELQGLRNTRIFDPASSTWSSTGQMHFGRWYPSTVTLADGEIFVASGVTKLIKPVYSNDPLDSGTNVRQTETFNPKTGLWTYNGASGDHSLPLFPRLHLLPDGKVYYDAGGQTFNPDGQSYDELTWNLNAVYDPATKSWTNLTIPGLGTTYPGFKGSTFSIMLPLAPPYNKASFLSAGGVYGVTPGTYLANNASTITSIDTSGGKDSSSTVQTGNLQNARWYSTGVLLPSGQVMAFSGSRQDGVVLPGLEIPVHQAELFDPATNTWTAMASGHRDRTYHNTAELLPSGAVLVGGHSPIPLGYGTQMTLPGGITANNEKDPSFEVYYPPYFSQSRPTILGARNTVQYGDVETITTPDAASITRVVMVRNTSITHLVDGDQRSVVLPIVGRTAGGVMVQIPTNRAVLPAGPYMLFIDKQSGTSLIPSVAQETFVGAPVPPWAQSTPPINTSVHRTSAAGARSVATSTVASSHASAATAATTGRISSGVAPSLATVAAVTPAVLPRGEPGRRAPSPLALLLGVSAAVAAGLATRRRLLATRPLWGEGG